MHNEKLKEYGSHKKLLITSQALAGLGILTWPASVLAQAACNTPNPSPAQLQACLQQNPIINDIQLVVNFLSAGLGVVVVAVIIVGGIQYMTAGDNPQAVSAAKQRIINGLIALMAFLLTFAFLNWLIPGGIFG